MTSWSVRQTVFWAGVLIMWWAQISLAAPPPCRIIYVDQATGIDSEERDGTNPNNPFQSIQFALDHADECDEVRVFPGIYVERIESEDVDTKLIALRTPEEHDVIIRSPLGDPGPVVFVDNDSFTIEGFVIEFASGPGIRFQGVSNGVAKDLIIRNCSGAGILVKVSSDIMLKNIVSHDNGADGIKVDALGGIRIINNLIYRNGDFGINIESDPNPTGPYEVMFNTVDESGLAAINVPRNKKGDVQGIIEHNITTNSMFGIKVGEEGFSVGYNCLFDNTVADLDTKSGVTLLGGDVFADPLYVNQGVEDGYHLSHENIQDEQSPCVDAGNVPAQDAIIRGSTASDGQIDKGIVDIGYHDTTPGEVIPMVIGFTEVTFKFNKKGNNESDAVMMEGKLFMGQGSDGIDPEVERVEVRSGQYAEVVPVGAVKREGSKWKYESRGPGIRKLEFEEEDDTVYSFEIKIEGIKIPNIKSVDLALVIGEDEGAVKVFYNRGTLHFNGETKNKKHD